jgi:hypothetical protein
MSSQEFIQNYGKVVAKTWADPAFFDTLKSSPAQTLGQYGITTKPDSKIYIVRVEPTGDGNVEKQVQDWEKGDRDGTYYLWIPTAPGDLGGEVSADDTSTTCTPCTTCT